ncbi:class I SAM-dependent methyltransferase [Streptomyces sp. NPDC006208]|uniref:class I SAM-dependent methyltransferase n=1 Tax=Streptomyces sp. NPDC006208 TaxID=3156734 RepID=UPI0033AE0036
MVSGVDLSPVQVARARRWWGGVPGLSFIHADVCDCLTSSTERFDAITRSGALCGSPTLSSASHWWPSASPPALSLPSARPSRSPARTAPVHAREMARRPRT